MQSDRNEDIKSALQVLNSRGTIAQVVDQVGPEVVLDGIPGDQGQAPNPVVKWVKNALGQAIAVVKQIDPVSKREEAIIEIEKHLKVDAERNSTVIAARYDADSAQAAQRILAALVDTYQLEHLRIHRNPDSGNFLADQRDLLLEKLNKAQAELTAAKNRIGVSSIEGRRSALEGQLQAIELELNNTRQELATVEARTKDISTKLAGTSERETSSRKSIPNEGADLMQDELYANQVRLMDYRSKYSANHPLVVTSERQMEQAKRIVDEQAKERLETVDDINPVYRELTLELARQQGILSGLSARRVELERQKLTTSNAIDQFNRDEIELDALRRNEQIARSKFFEYNNSFEQARVDEAREKDRISSVSVVQPATLAEKPVSPSKPLVLAGGCFLALASVISVIFISERLNGNLRNARELPGSLKLPVLATLSECTANRKLLYKL
jgi:uncharacterized protein involved in exopolysaccharide biosynthesis